MRFYIPSMQRSDRVKDGPLYQFKAGSDIVYVVPEDEVPAYAAVLPSSVEVIGCPEKGIAATRRWIGQHAWVHGHDKFGMIDDDVQFLIRKSPDVWNLREATQEEVSQMTTWIEKLLEEHAHVGVSAREGQNRIGVGGTDLIAVNTRTLRVLCYVTEKFLSVEHGRVAVMEDFDVNLQLLRAGHSNANVGYWAQGQKMTNAPGGCSTYRSHEVHEASAKKLAELHPGFVTLRQKKNKTDASGFGTRTEVTIQWKKAFGADT